MTIVPTQCHCCDAELALGPRYKLSFRCCPECTEKVVRNESAPLRLPGMAGQIVEHEKPAEEEQVRCHLCCNTHAAPAIGTLALQLCEGCFQLPADKELRRFTSSLTLLSGEGFLEEQPVCDGCSKCPGKTSYVISFFACRHCAARRCTLSALTLRLPCGLRASAGAFACMPKSAFTQPKYSATRNVSSDGWSCDACFNPLPGENAFILDYCLCGSCQSNPPALVRHHYKSMFRRVTPDFGVPQPVQYIRGKELGSGGMGTVYVVTSPVNGRQYAEKVVRLRSEDRAAQRDAEKEAVLLTKFCHPNVVETMEAYFNRKTRSLHMVLELAELGALNCWIEKRCRAKKPFDELQVWSYFRHICNGVAYLHAQGIAHRDIKPHNILIFRGADNDCVLKLADLGIACQLTGNETRVSGTGGYLAPEMARAYLAGSRVVAGLSADMWSLGVVLYELNYLKHPFHQAGQPAWNQVKNANIRLPILPRRSSDMRSLLSQLLLQNPSQRPSISDTLDVVRRHVW